MSSIPSKVADKEDLKKIAKAIKDLVKLEQKARRLNQKKISGSKTFEALKGGEREAQKLINQYGDLSKLKEVDGALNNIWKAYLKGYKATAKDLEINPNKVKEKNKQEFFTFLLANQFTDFNPVDNVAAYLQGDIQIDGADVQLKAHGGEFQIAYSMKGFQSQIKSWKTPDAAIYGFDPDVITAIGKVQLEADLITKNFTKPDQSLEQKVKIMERYVEISRATWYVLQAATKPMPGSLIGISVAVPKSKLLLFLKTHPHFFKVTSSGSKKRKAGLFPFRLQLEMKQSLPVIFKVGISKPQFSLHYHVSRDFYLSRGIINYSTKRLVTQLTADPPSGYSARDVLHYNNFIHGPYWDKFEMIHDNLFGGLDY